VCENETDQNKLNDTQFRHSKNETLIECVNLLSGVGCRVHRLCFISGHLLYTDEIFIVPPDTGSI
jgi:hypothetical protein